MVRRYGTSEADYSTDVLTQQAVQFINKSRTDRRPFFLYLAPYAPHLPLIPAPRHKGKLAGGVGGREGCCPGRRAGEQEVTRRAGS